MQQQNEIANLGYNHLFQFVNWDKKYVPFAYWPINTHFGSLVSGQVILSKYPIITSERVVLLGVEKALFYRDAFYLERLAQVAKVLIQSKEIVVINVHLEAFDRATRLLQFEEVLQLFNKYK